MIAFHLGQLALGAVLAAVIAASGYATGALSRGGVAGAVVVGTTVFGIGGPLWGALLVVFFATSSLLTEWHAAEKAEPAARFAKGARRDFGQVLANGGAAAALALAQAWLPQVDLFPAFVGAMAAVTADTWATEIGLLSSVPPHLITTGRPVPRGTSGGVTVLGTAAAVAGGMLIGLVAAVMIAVADVARFGVPHLSLANLTGARFLLIAPVAGLASAAFDSWLGATAQAAYGDVAAGRETERRADADGHPLARIRGRGWVTNDAVNLAASVVGGALGWAIDRVVLG